MKKKVRREKENSLVTKNNKSKITKSAEKDIEKSKKKKEE